VGRALSTQIELMIETAAREQRMLFETSALAFGPEVAAIGLAVMEAMSAVGPLSTIVSNTGGAYARGIWMDSAYAARKMVEAAQHIINTINPTDDEVAANPPHFLGEPAAQFARAFLDHLPGVKAREALAAILSDPKQAERLGEAMRRRVQAFLDATQTLGGPTPGPTPDADKL
jgi:hypothetical protein